MRRLAAFLFPSVLACSLLTGQTSPQPPQKVLALTHVIVELVGAMSRAGVDNDFREEELNSLGYQLLQAKKVKQAIRILLLNAEAYPQSGNVYDSLAEAYMINGDKELAIANYRKSLQLDPANKNAVEMLKKLAAP